MTMQQQTKTQNDIIRAKSQKYNAMTEAFYGAKVSEDTNWQTMFIVIRQLERRKSTRYQVNNAA